MRDDQEAAEGRMTERGSECEEEEEEEEEKKGDELKAEGKGEEEEPVLLAPCSSNSSCILLTFPSSIPGHPIAPNYFSLAAPTHPKWPSDFLVRWAPNTQRAPRISPRSSQKTMLCSVRVLAAVSNHGEAIRGYVHACTRELVNGCSRDLVKAWRLLEPKRARSARVVLAKP